MTPPTEAAAEALSLLAEYLEAAKANEGESVYSYSRSAFDLSAAHKRIHALKPADLLALAAALVTPAPAPAEAVAERDRLREAVGVYATHIAACLGIDDDKMLAMFQAALAQPQPTPARVPPAQAFEEMRAALPEGFQFPAEFLAEHLGPPVMSQNPEKSDMSAERVASLDMFGDEEVLGRVNGYILTRNYLWGPSGDAVAEVVNGQLEIHPDLMDALALLPPRFKPQPAPDALREALEAAARGFEHLASLSARRKRDAGQAFIEAGNEMSTSFEELEEEARILEGPCKTAERYAKQARAALAQAVSE